ncbi:hypothetical protein PYW07_003540 [Mythimna separata]|uniref:Uncharacterized protein n=1 Tax=Mythimna separata TaxID=271217 RepID=A0AAD7YI38_MYTSE|nr:hypothetical protein PYW07_003540 [Mythimna separata]
MSLFPAYAQDSSDNKTDNEVKEPCSELAALEAQLLASDNDDEQSAGEGAAEPGAQPAREPSLCDQQDYYLDRNFDIGNLRVSTLYYPGRPQYKSMAPWAALGEKGGAGAKARARARRYFAAPPPAPTAPHDDAERAARAAAFRVLLAQDPADEATWLRYIDFQEQAWSAEAALAAAGEAAAKLRGSRRVRAALHRARGVALAPRERLHALRQDLAAPGAGGAPGDADSLLELWLHVLAAAAAAGAADLEAAADAALAATRALPLAYPHVLYEYGAALRAAGLWERLVLLLELVCSMNFPPAAFPPRDLPERLHTAEQQLQHLEDKVSSSGLPVSTMWVRVERARAAAHWRAPPAGVSDPDPQRAPAPADVAALLRPCAPAAAPLLLLQALRLAQVPLLPCAGYALRPAAAANDARGDAAEADGADALLALLRAARRLPPAHAARAAPGVAARLLAVFAEPPHYYSDEAGYLSWLSALWDAAAAWLPPEQRVALLCWRLRWLHALVLLLDPQEAVGKREARRIRMEARAALKRFAGTSPLPYVHFARIEHAAAELAGARRAALHALRAAHADPAVPPHQRLYVARVAGEVCGSAVGLWGTVCGALEQALPPDEQLDAAPDAALRARALQACEAQCARLEAQQDARAPAALDALLPAPAEWAAARTRLAGPRRRAELLRAVLAAAPGECAAAERYWEQSACALALEATRDQRLAQCARALAPLFPHNGLLALACSGAPLWAWERGGTQEERLRALAGAARSHRGAIAHALPALLRAAAAAWDPAAAARAAAACARAGRAGAGGALLHTLRLESEARACAVRPAAALLAALDRYPQHKWLAVRGAAWCPALCASLADVLLERGLRAHALLDELAPAPAPEPH